MVDDPRVLVDAASRDDAAVFRLSDDRALVATVDFFTPIVDDAYAFGRIAAANAFSDVFAMGATPLLALNLVGWPRDPDMLELLGETLRGGSDIAREAGALVLGGHSIDDAEPKYGMVAIGEVSPDRIWSLDGARPEDRLVLTKPLGTGVLATALKRDLVAESDIGEATRVMATLNRGAADAIRTVGEDAIHAVTDVTGFGLLGHLHNMLVASGMAARVDLAALPVFEGVRELIDRGAVPGGTTRNADAAEEWTRWGAEVGKGARVLAADAQTSGGLLVAVAADTVDDLVASLGARGTPAAAVVGEVVEGPAGTISVTG